jgi:N-acetylglucosaminyldiphosphoundecaprenol N-acetyl-beta-D-mannosaminyltransferase
MPTKQPEGRPRGTFGFGSVDFTLIRRAELRPVLRAWASRPGPSLSMTLTGAHGVTESRSQPAVQQAHDDADFVLCDGTPPYIAAVLRGHGADVDRIPGLVAMLEISAEASALGLEQAFIGGPPGLAEKTRKGLETATGGSIEGLTWSPPFVHAVDDAYADGVAEQLRPLHAPAVVWIGLSTPKQEVLAASLKRRLPRGFFFIAVGAAFDIYAGTLVAPPPLFSRLGLAWLHRCFQEPRRLPARYARALPVVVRALLDAGRARLRGR